MGSGRKYVARFLTLVVVLLAGRAWAQLTLGQTTLHGNGAVSFGYGGSFGITSSNQEQVGFNGNLSGSYYNPQFLQFTLAPYYNQSSLNSEVNSSTNARGLNFLANLFSGSNIPIQITFNRSYNHEGQFNLPGSPGFITEGNQQDFSVSWTGTFKHLPTLRFGFTDSSSSYDLISDRETTGSGHSRSFNVGANYKLLGFNLNGAYTHLNMTSETPSIANVQGTNQFTTQDTKQAGFSRNLFNGVAWSGSYSRGDFTADFGPTTTQQSYDTWNSNVSLQPTSKLNLNLGVNYTTNVSGLLLQSLLLPAAPNSVGSSVVPVSSAGLAQTSSSDYMTYGASAGYTMTSELKAKATLQHSMQEFGGLSATNDTVSSGIGYARRRPLFGGKLSANYNLSWSQSDTSNSASTQPENSSSAIGQSFGAAYSHPFLGWQHSGIFQLSKNQNTSVLTFTSNGYSFGITSSGIVRRWRAQLSARVSKVSIQGLSASDSTSSSYSATLAGNHFSFSGSMAFGSGTSFQNIVGFQTVTAPGAVLVPNALLTGYQSTSFSGGMTYHPTRNLNVRGNYTHSRVNLNNTAGDSQNLIAQLDVKLEYRLRKLNFTAGFDRITQGTLTGATASGILPGPTTANAYYVGISRHFDFF
ncbi:MAG: hypothetical protein ACR2IF_17670 [Terriglobales bacterium]